jgi:hypothetical protein
VGGVLVSGFHSTCFLLSFEERKKERSKGKGLDIIMSHVDLLRRYGTTSYFLIQQRKKIQLWINLFSQRKRILEFLFVGRKRFLASPPPPRQINGLWLFLRQDWIIGWVVVGGSNHDNNNNNNAPHHPKAHPQLVTTLLS